MSRKFTIVDRLTFSYPNQDSDWNIRKNKNRYLRLLLSLALKFSNQWKKRELSIRLNNSDESLLHYGRNE